MAERGRRMPGCRCSLGPKLAAAKRETGRLLHDVSRLRHAGSLDPARMPRRDRLGLQPRRRACRRTLVLVHMREYHANMTRRAPKTARQARHAARPSGPTAERHPASADAESCCSNRPRHATAPPRPLPRRVSAAKRCAHLRSAQSDQADARALTMHPGRRLARPLIHGHLQKNTHLPPRVQSWCHPLPPPLPPSPPPPLPPPRPPPQTRAGEATS
eukprot:6180610-Pleurochrysis_carterae.AAC.1